MKIFVSYRRTDSDAVGRMSDRLISEFGQTSVFLDVDNIPAGLDFRRVIGDTIDSSACIIVAIGDGWLRSRSDSADDTASLNKKNDFVRLEVSMALEKKIPIIPVLLGSAGMPEPETLPEDIRSLAYLNATSLRSGRDFHQDIKFLIDAVKSFIDDEYASLESTAQSSAADTPSAPKNLTADLQFSATQLVSAPNELCGKTIGRYQLQSFIASGGGGNVFLAVDKNLGRQLCIKVAHPVDAEVSNLKAIVARGTWGIVRMAHPGIVAIFDFDSFVTVDLKKSFYLCMEYVDGPNFKAWASSLNDKQFVEKLLTALKAVAKTLHDAHSYIYIGDDGVENVGILHGDIKPNNVVMVGDNPKLLDFMLVDVQKLITHAPPPDQINPDHHTMAFGTPSFMAPEQESGIITRKSDIFSFGKMIHELVELKSMESFDENASYQIQQLIALANQCTQTMPEQRPDSMEAIHAILSNIHATTSQKPILSKQNSLHQHQTQRDHAWPKAEKLIAPAKKSFWSTLKEGFTKAAPASAMPVHNSLYCTECSHHNTIIKQDFYCQSCGSHNLYDRTCIKNQRCGHMTPPSSFCRECGQ